MIVLILIAAAAALLAVGIGVGSILLDAIALGVAALGVLIVVVTWILPLLNRATPEVEEPTESASRNPIPEVEEQATPASRNPEPSVVFVAGRTTFHLDDCSLVAGKTTSRAQRGDLETGGMAACKRCIKT